MIDRKGRERGLRASAGRVDDHTCRGDLELGLHGVSAILGVP